MGRYVEISVRGEFSGLLEAELDEAAGMVDRGVTWVRLVVRDASALHGVLGRLDALDLELLSVHPLDETPPP
jgi:hypothetical protein